MNAKSVLRIIKVMIMSFLLLMTACSPLVVVPPTSGESLPTALPTLQPTATAEALGSINGWVWHDECAIFESAEDSPNNLNAGCVGGAGGVHADGLKTSNEQLIGGVKVSLGSGACPSTGLVETTTIVTDLSYSFTDLSAGTYCISIDPTREPNTSILLPGNWTYPTLTYGPASMTIALKAGENKFDVNFGWDYQFLPAIAQPTASSAPVVTGCQDAAQYISDDGLDGTTYAPNTPFTKTWRLKNIGSCTWDSNYLVSQLSGAFMTQQPSYLLVPPGQTVAPGQTVNVSVGMTSPPENGSYQSDWGLQKKNGPFLPIRSGANGISFYVKIKVDDGTVAGNITAASIAIEREEGSGTVCTADATYFVYAAITADGPATANYEINSTTGQIPAGYFQTSPTGPVSVVVTGTLPFDRADTKTIALRFAGPYPYPDDITVNLRVNGGEWHSTKLSCQ